VAVAGELAQRRGQPDPDRYLGRGKLTELKRAVAEAGATVTVDRTGGPSAVVRVSGAVDVPVAEHLRIRLLEASHGGTVPVTLDLGPATGFGSAAVRVALGMARIAQDEGWRLAVRVPAASGVRHVLEVGGVAGLVDLVGV
jgi:hypothetical protein